MKRVDRRDFLRISAGRPPTLEIDCESLYMHYLDSRAEGREEELFTRLSSKLGRVSAVRLRQSFWLSRPELGEAVTPLLEAFRFRGGAVLR